MRGWTPKASNGRIPSPQPCFSPTISRQREETPMPAYLIANIRVKDPAKFAAYRELVAPMIARFGGRYLIRGGAVTPVEGEPVFARVVVLEFPTMDGLKTF